MMPIILRPQRVDEPDQVSLFLFWRRTMKKMSFVLGLFLACLAVSACSTAPQSEDGRQDLSRDTGQTLNEFRASDSDIADQINDAYGYAVFPHVAKGGAGVGGAYGRGMV